jgi:hypothetical protein
MTVKALSAGGTKYWILILNEATNMKWSYLDKPRSDLKDMNVVFSKNLSSRITHPVVLWNNHFIPSKYKIEQRSLMVVFQMRLGTTSRQHVQQM